MKQVGQKITKQKMSCFLIAFCYPRLLVLFKKPIAFENTQDLFNSKRSNDVNQAVGLNPSMQLSLYIINIPAI